VRPGSRIALLAIVVVVIGVGLYSMRRTHAPGHRPAPDFNLPQLNGQPLHLASYRGKVVLLDFWATWCVPCRAEIPHFIELQQKYGDRGLQIIGVSMDDGPEPVRDFYQQFHMNYPVVMGNAKTGELYGGVLGLPIAFIIGKDGLIDSKKIGAADMAVLEREIQKLL